MEAFEGSVKALRVGDPLDDDTEMGPLISASHREKVGSYVEDGAPVAFRGSAPDGPGYWFPPTVLAPVSNDDRAAREEIFGPVAAVIPFEDEAEARAARERHDLRPLGLDLDARRREGTPRRPRPRVRDALGQLEHVRPGADAVRRLQAVGRRPRARAARARLLHRAQERLHRHWLSGPSQVAPLRAIAIGLAATGADRIPKEFGLLLAVAILTDALIVRMTLVPAFLTLLGEKSWYIPRWLDRLLPNLTIEAPQDGGPPRRIEAERPAESVGRR